MLVYFSSPGNTIPFMSSSRRKLQEHISTDNTNRRALNGQPCLIPHSKLNQPVCQPSLLTQLCVSQFKTVIQEINPGRKIIFLQYFKHKFF